VTARFAASVLALVSLTAADATLAQAYPTRPIRLIVATEAGGVSDALARTLGPEMAKELGVAIVAENRGGASGGVGATLVAQAAPDGYTILIGGANALVSAPLMSGVANYDPLRQFAPIGAIARVPYAIAVAPRLGVRTVPELVALAKASPGGLTYGSGAIGSTSHVIMALIEARTGAKFLNVPYRSAVSGVQELVGGRLDVAGSELARLVPLERAGHLRIIAATGDRRSRTLPTLPTVAEQGLPGFDVDTWYGLFAPAGTPDTVIATLSRALAVALRAPEVVQLIDAREYEPLPNAPDDLRTLVIEETRRLRTLVQGNGIATQR